MAEEPEEEPQPEPAIEELLDTTEEIIPDEPEDTLTNDIDDIELPDEISSVLEDVSETDEEDLLDEIEEIAEGDIEELEDIIDLPEDIEDVQDDAADEDLLTGEEKDEIVDLPEDIEEASKEQVIEELLHEDTASPMDELKTVSADSIGGGVESFEKLKTLSKKIIDGEQIDIGIDIKSEISELLKLILDTKRRVDEIEPTLATSKEQIPNVLQTLESVTESTEDATLTLMGNADDLNNYYQEFLEEINDVEDLVYKKDAKSIIKKIEALEKGVERADSMGFNILQALEFQDITEQKLHKVITATNDIGARIGAILGFIKLKYEQNPEAVDDASQDDIDKLLAEFGLD